MFGHSEPSQVHTGDDTDYYSFGILHEKTGQLFLNHAPGQNITLLGNNSSTHKLVYDGTNGRINTNTSITGSLGGIRLTGGGGIVFNSSTDNKVADLAYTGGPSINDKNRILINAACANEDVTFLRVQNSINDLRGYGYSFIYSGSGSGINNRLVIAADGTKGIDGVDTEAPIKTIDINNFGFAKISGERRVIKSNFSITQSELAAAAERLFFLGGPLSGDSAASGISFPTYNRYAFTVPYDGYVSFVSMLAYYSIGAESAEGDGAQGPVVFRVYRKAFDDSTDISFGDSSSDLLATFNVNYFMLKRSGFTQNYYMSGRNQRSNEFIGDNINDINNSKFNAGDQLWMTVQCPSGVSVFHSGQGLISSIVTSTSDNHLNIGLNVVYQTGNGAEPSVIT